MKVPNIKFRLVGNVLTRADRWADVTQVRGIFRDCAKAPKNVNEVHKSVYSALFAVHFA